MAKRSKVRVCCCSLAKIADSNPAGVVDVSVSFECCMLPGIGLCDGPIPHPEKTCKLLCVTHSKLRIVLVFDPLFWSPVIHCKVQWGCRCPRDQLRQCHQEITVYRWINVELVSSRGFRITSLPSGIPFNFYISNGVCSYTACFGPDDAWVISAFSLLNKSLFNSRQFLSTLHLQ
jgi:hypothetical protein